MTKRNVLLLFLLLVITALGANRREYVVQKDNTLRGILRSFTLDCDLTKFVASNPDVTPKIKIGQKLIFDLLPDEAEWPTSKQADAIVEKVMTQILERQAGRHAQILLLGVVVGLVLIVVTAAIALRKRETPTAAPPEPERGIITDPPPPARQYPPPEVIGPIPVESGPPAFVLITPELPRKPPTVIRPDSSTTRVIDGLPREPVGIREVLDRNPIAPPPRVMFRHVGSLADFKAVAYGRPMDPTALELRAHGKFPIGIYVSIENYQGLNLLLPATVTLNTDSVNLKVRFADEEPVGFQGSERRRAGIAWINKVPRESWESLGIVSTPTDQPA